MGFFGKTLFKIGWRLLIGFLDLLPFSITGMLISFVIFLMFFCYIQLGCFELNLQALMLMSDVNLQGKFCSCGNAGFVPMFLRAIFIVTMVTTLPENLIVEF